MAYGEFVNEVTTLVAAGLVYTVIVMWAGQPPYTCDLPSEPHRHLNLEKDVDREHLERDAREISRMAVRYARHTDGAVGECQTKLVHDVMNTHDLAEWPLSTSLVPDTSAGSFRPGLLGP
jgi:hypothetical protein